MLSLSGFVLYIKHFNHDDQTWDLRLCSLIFYTILLLSRLYSYSNGLKEKLKVFPHNDKFVKMINRNYKSQEDNN